MNGGYLAGGPLVWLITMVITTLLLVASTKALWLVVPLLIAIILYYMLYPVVRRLTLSGISREAAAGIVAGGVTALAVLVMIPLLPWLAAQSVAGQETFYRYLEGGRVLIDRLLAGLESQFAFLRRLDFHAEVGKRLSEFGDTKVQEKISQVLLAAAASLPTLLLAPFFAFFFLRDGTLFTKLVTRGIPNAFFERTIYMFERVDATAKSYFQGLLQLTAIDTIILGTGFLIVGVPNAIVIALIAAFLEWIPIVGSVIGCGLAVLIAASAHQNELWVVYGVLAVFGINRMLDNFFFIPLTVGRSVRMHPLPAVLMVFIGGAVAGIPGLILALPLAGVVGTIVGTIFGIVRDPRLRARNAHARALLHKRVTSDLVI
ncbi:MAG: AI-2E family transporter [Burkholderiales bacterium]